MANPSATLNSIVSLRDVGKTFDNGVVALAGLSLDVHAGEFVSLLGPSGCGKSTALRIVAGLSAPTRGTVEWPQGRAAEAAKGEIGFVFQEPTLMPWASVARNVELPLSLAGVAPAVARGAVATALAHVGLGEFVDAFPRELSGGMKMRVSIARALVTEPRLLLMDEPFAALDEITRQKLNDDLLRLWEQFGWTIVFVTHSVFESVYLSSRIVVMAARPGRVIDEIAVDSPHPRGIGFRTSQAYGDYCRRASESLLSAIGAADHL